MNDNRTQHSKSMLFMIILTVSFLLIYHNYFNVVVNAADLQHLPSTSISDIYTTPEIYENQLVKIEGEVVKSFYFFFAGGYTVKDQKTQATILVLTSEFTPEKGDTVIVTAKVKPSLRLGTAARVLLLEVKPTTAMNMR
ncbi:MAG: hypothetical protein AAGG75_09865 [Bacteroidota bacterium]